MVEIAPRIVVDETVKFGKPVIKGTRVPVDLVLGKLGGGMTVEEVMAEYELAREDVLTSRLGGHVIPILHRGNLQVSCLPQVAEPRLAAQPRILQLEYVSGRGTSSLPRSLQSSGRLSQDNTYLAR